MRIYCAATRILFTTSSSFLHSSASLISNQQHQHQRLLCSRSSSRSSIRTRIVTRNMSDHNSDNATPAVLLHKSPFLDDIDDDDNDTTTTTQTALVILNSPIQKPPSPLFEALWNKSQYRVCADGGANRLYRSTVNVPATAVNAAATTTDADADAQQQQQQQYIPNLIIGDLDSLQKHVGDYYNNKQASISSASASISASISASSASAANGGGGGDSGTCHIVCDPDQDHNDLDKALGAILKHQQQQYEMTASNGNGNNRRYRYRVLVYGAFGGRFDQEMGCIQALYKWSPRFDDNMWLYDDQTVCFLLPADRTNHIRLPRYGNIDDNDTNDTNTVKNDVLGEGPTCGLIPIGGTVDSVTTAGFQWNLHRDATAFGGLLSTSNRVMAETVTVTASHPLVFTAEIYSGIPAPQTSGEDAEEAPTIWKNELSE